MFQVEIYEYTPKLSDLYYHFYTHIENNVINSDNVHVEEFIETRFTAVKAIRYNLIARYIDYIKDDCNNFVN
jgi:hypothetical protein